MKRRRAEAAVVRAAMRQHELLYRKPVPVNEWAKAEEELGKACAALAASRGKQRKRGRG